MRKYKVWNCKMVISGDAELPKGFDFPPRQAAETAVKNAGFNIISCFSGWGANLSKEEVACIERDD